MIRALRYRDGIPDAEHIDPERLRDALGEPDSVLWIDLEAPESAEILRVVEQLGVHDLAVEDLHNPRQRTKLVPYDDHWHVALHDCELDGAELATAEVDILFAEGWIVTVRHPADGTAAPWPVDAARLRFERQRVEHGSNDEGFVLWAVLDQVVDRYFTVTEAINDRLDDLEDVVFAEQPEGIPREAFQVRRALVGFRRAVGPLREVVGELLRREVPCVGPAALVHLQDVFDHVLRVLDLVESQRELLAGLVEAQLAVMSNRMGEVMKKTSSWGAILIVATLIAGIYGMNFRHMPELAWALGYPAAILSMIVVTGILYVVFKRKDWL